MGDVIYMSDYRPEQKREPRPSAYLQDVCLSPEFNPDWEDDLIIRALVYNQPSLLDSYYAMYPNEVSLIRYEDAIIINRVWTNELLTVVRLADDGLWYADEAPNANV